MSYKHYYLTQPHVKWGMRSLGSDLLEFLERLKSLRLLGAALAHKEALHFSPTGLLHFGDLACASA